MLQDRSIDPYGIRELDDDELFAIRGGEAAPSWDSTWIGADDDACPDRLPPAPALPD